jgi:hypothetical protein
MLDPFPKCVGNQFLGHGPFSEIAAADAFFEGYFYQSTLRGMHYQLGCVRGSEANTVLSAPVTGRFRSRIAKAETKNPVGAFFTYLKIARARP